MGSNRMGTGMDSTLSMSSVSTLSEHVLQTLILLKLWAQTGMSSTLFCVCLHSTSSDFLPNRDRSKLTLARSNPPRLASIHKNPCCQPCHPAIDNGEQGSIYDFKTPN
nr:hypothetical protein Q903MT_gene1902 [Picea sitchensis]